MLTSTRERDRSCSSIKTVPVTGPRWPRTCETIRCRTLNPALAWAVSTSHVAEAAGAAAGAAAGTEAGRRVLVSVVVVSMWNVLSPATMRTWQSFNKWMVMITYIHAMNISSLNLNLLPVLDALLAERSVSRAGARVGLSQPAVSNALAQLREHFGDPLLVREGNGMAPTERALALAGPLRTALLALEHGLQPAEAFDPASAERGFTIMTNDFV